jgi:aldose 1-epimerase
MMLRILGTALLVGGLAGAADAASVTSSPYGTMKDGRQVDQVTLTNDNGMTVRFLSFGAIITDIAVPDRTGKAANVVLGYGSFAEWEPRIRKNFFGAAIGRYAGRTGGARFTLDGKEVQLQPNDGPNALHGGGNVGFESKLWSVRTFEQPEAVGAVLTYASPEGEQGFPGALTVQVTYRLLADNSFRIDYDATTTAPTVLNLTNHSYFNLAGAGSGSVTPEELQIFGTRYVAMDDAGIPTGEFPAAAGTPLDFERPTPIAKNADFKGPPLTPKGGFNNSWLLDKPEGQMGAAAVLHDPASGRTLQLFTTEPSLHVYTGDYMDGTDVGAQGVVYHARDGVALETQHLSDSPNKPAFPSTVLRPGETFHSATVYHFTAE